MCRGLYSFKDDADGSHPADWTYYEPEGCEVLVKSSKGSHKKVLRVMDNNNSYITWAEQSFGDRTSGTVEFYFTVPDKTKQVSPAGGLLYDGIQVVLLAISRNWAGQGYLEVYDGGSGYRQVLQLTDDQWYHVRIDFECGTGEYKDLIQYTFKLYVDGTEYGPYDFISERSMVRRIKFSTWSNGLPFDIYVDAVDYSWADGYFEGRNKTLDKEKIKETYALEV